MRKIFVLALLVLACASNSFAQGTDESRAEFFVGYSNLQAEGITGFDQDDDPFDNDVEEFFEDRTGLNGINAAVTGYFTPRFGITGDFSFHQQGRDTGDSSNGSEINIRRFNVLAGPTVKFRNDSRVEPVLRAMAGAANTRFEAEDRFTTTTGGQTTNRFETSSTDFTLAIGGGLDVRLNDRVAIRAIQLDYNPIFFRDRTIDVLGSTGTFRTDLSGQRADNVRFSVGVVFK